MRYLAKLFMNGRSQAVRLPINFRFDCKEVFIRKDEKTGDIILSKKPGNWKDFFHLCETVNIPEDFMPEDFMDSRDNVIESEKKIF